MQPGHSTTAKYYTRLFVAAGLRGTASDICLLLGPFGDSEVACRPRCWLTLDPRFFLLMAYDEFFSGLGPDQWLPDQSRRPDDYSRLQAAASKPRASGPIAVIRPYRANHGKQRVHPFVLPQLESRRALFKPQQLPTGSIAVRTVTIVLVPSRRTARHRKGAGATRRGHTGTDQNRSFRTRRWLHALHPDILPDDVGLP